MTTYSAPPPLLQVPGGLPVQLQGMDEPLVLRLEEAEEVLSIKVRTKGFDTHFQGHARRAASILNKIVFLTHTCRHACSDACLRTCRHAGTHAHTHNTGTHARACSHAHAHMHTNMCAHAHAHTLYRRAAPALPPSVSSRGCSVGSGCATCSNCRSCVCPPSINKQSSRGGGGAEYHHHCLLEAMCWRSAGRPRQAW